MSAETARRVALYASVGSELTHYEMDVAGAALARRGTVSLPGNVQYCWPHASRHFLYVASSGGEPRTASSAVGGHHLTALAIDPATGELSPHAAPVPLPARPIHVTTDIPSDYILVAFSNPSGLRVYRIDPDGAPGAEVAQPEAIEAGVFGHQVRVRLDNRKVILVTRGHDAAGTEPEHPGALKIFDYHDGLLTGEVSVAPNAGYGFGPRNLDFHPEKQWVYVALERQNRLDTFAFDNGKLSAEPLFRAGTLAEPDNIRGRQVVGTVKVHPSGRFVYAVNRAASTIEMGGRKVFVGGENSLAVFAIDPTSGKPGLIQHADTHGIHCRTFHIDPGGDLLVAAHSMGLSVRDGAAIRFVPACLSLFRIAGDGKLDFVRNYDVDVGDRAMFWMGMV